MPRDNSGCTATSLVITPDAYLVFNTGDSRLTVAREACHFETTDHSPDVPTEMARIEAAGGCIFFGRVNGVLAVTRAFGDFEFKDATKEAADHVVTVLPDITVLPRSPTDEFILLACDGIWGTLFTSQVLAFAREALASGLALEHVTGALIETCFRLDSRDNMTAMIVALPGIKQGSPAAAGDEVEFTSRMTSSLRSSSRPPYTAREMGTGAGAGWSNTEARLYSLGTSTDTAACELAQLRARVAALSEAFGQPL